MGWLADSHQEWHHANPKRPWDCPLDCGIAEARYANWDAEQEEERHHIVCGACRDLHETVAEVRACYASAT